MCRMPSRKRKRRVAAEDGELPAKRALVAEHDNDPQRTFVPTSQDGSSFTGQYELRNSSIHQGNVINHYFPSDHRSIDRRQASDSPGLDIPTTHPPANNQRPQPGEGWTFRVRGIPPGWDVDRLCTFLADQDDFACLSVRSLAVEVHGRWQTATAACQNTHSLLQTAGRARRIPLPAVPNPPSPACLTLDDDFLGLTTLYTPPSEHHKIE